MPNTATRLTPLVESRPTEEQLAASAVLLGGNRPCSREPPKRVSMETQVLRGLAGVKPLVSPIDTVVLKASNHCRRHAVDETVDQQIDHRAVVAGRDNPAGSTSQRGLRASLLPRLHHVRPSADLFQPGAAEEVARAAASRTLTSS